MNQNMDYTSSADYHHPDQVRHHRYSSQDNVPSGVALQMFLENKFQMRSPYIITSSSRHGDKNKKSSMTKLMNHLKVDNTPILMLQSPQETLDYLFKQQSKVANDKMYFPGQYTKQQRQGIHKVKQQTATTASTTFHNRSIDMRTETNFNTHLATPASTKKDECAQNNNNPSRRSAKIQTSFQNIDLQKELSKDTQDSKKTQKTKTDCAGTSLRGQSATVKNSFLRRSIDYQKEPVQKYKIAGRSMTNSFDKNSTQENIKVNEKTITERRPAEVKIRQQSNSFMLRKISEKTVNTASNKELIKDSSNNQIIQSFNDENQSRAQLALSRTGSLTKNTSQLRLNTSMINRNNSQSSIVNHQSSAKIVQKRPGSSLSQDKGLPAPVFVKKKKPVNISIGQIPRVDRKNLQIKNGQLKFKQDDNSKPRASPTRKKPVIETVPVYKRSFVVIDQEKYAFWIEQKKKATVPALAPPSENEKKDERKLLSEHSLSKMTKRSFPFQNSLNDKKRPQTAKSGPKILSHSHIHHHHNEQVHNPQLLNDKEKSKSPKKGFTDQPAHQCSRHVFHHTSKAEIVAENKKIISALQQEIKDIRKAEQEKRDAMTGQLVQADPKKIDEAYRRNVNMREYYRLQALNLNKVFTEAEKEGKVDMVYKIYWDPKKWVKPLEDEKALKKNKGI